MSSNEILLIAVVAMLLISGMMLRFVFSYRSQIKDLKEEAKKIKSEFSRKTVELTHERDAVIEEKNRIINVSNRDIEDCNNAIKTHSEKSDLIIKRTEAEDR
ncbi:hypothetical protein [Bartonella queenslandensis]|uniref:hypothetical protein n=1 Tax=Bartonella queenslandensis TaxID=481138 RepID=UPI0002EF5220|nr:hypothetical protein [Bartonella queenslandensis]